MRCLLIGVLSLCVVFGIVGCRNDRAADTAKSSPTIDPAELEKETQKEVDEIKRRMADKDTTESPWVQGKDVETGASADLAKDSTPGALAAEMRRATEVVGVQTECIVLHKLSYGGEPSDRLCKTVVGEGWDAIPMCDRRTLHIYSSLSQVVRTITDYPIDCKVFDQAKANLPKEK